MDKKIIFFDIDGTLLDQETSTIPQSAVDAIEKAMQNGHYCFINTGRPKCTLDQSVLDIPLMDIFVDVEHILNIKTNKFYITIYQKKHVKKQFVQFMIHIVMLF